MSNHSDLNAFIARLQQRLRLGAWLRGAAIFTGTALTVTVVMVLVLNRLAFPEHGVTAARLSIFAALAVAAVYGVVVPVLRMTRARAVISIEDANPEIEQTADHFSGTRRQCRRSISGAAGRRHSSADSACNACLAGSRQSPVRAGRSSGWDALPCFYG